MNKNLCLGLLLFVFILPNKFQSQQRYEKSFAGGILFLSNYIASDDFKELKKNYSDLDLTDSLYYKALKFWEGDVSESLLSLTFACLPFNIIKLDLKLFKLDLFLPSPNQQVFQKRLENLPSKLFFNSPTNDFGDKDKLSHFFGNAFLHYNVSLFNFSKFMGIFVEKTEQSFFSNGGFDKRDIIANHLGEIFSEMLKLNKHSKPSKALLIYQILYFRDGK